MYLKQNLKYLRESKGLLQEDIAKIVNVGQKAVSNWELGERVPTIETIVKMAKYFEVTLDELVLTELKPPIPVYARNIRFLREKAGLKQVDIADLLRVEQSTVALYEKNKRSMKIEDLEKVADFFGVTMDQMIKQDLSKEI